MNKQMYTVLRSRDLKSNEMNLFMVIFSDLDSHEQTPCSITLFRILAAFSSDLQSRPTALMSFMCAVKTYDPGMTQES